MSMAFGFYWGVFYPPHCNHPYQPPDDTQNSNHCFASIGQPEDYKGFLYQTTELRSDYILYA